MGQRPSWCSKTFSYSSDVTLNIVRSRDSRALSLVDCDDLIAGLDTLVLVFLGDNYFSVA